MKKTTEKGFTLIELLAVIVILAIIALIAVPVIMNIINKANRATFKDTAYGIISAGELYFAEQQLEPSGMTEDVTINLPDERIPLKGEIPKGNIKITKEGKISISITNGRYCITKGIDDNDITVNDNLEKCGINDDEDNNDDNILDDENNSTEEVTTVKSLFNLATTSEEISMIPNCITEGNTCAVGTPVALKVNDDTIYNFYIINDENNEVTLIMNKNLGSRMAWGNTLSDGPTIAVAALKVRTSDWTNIEERDYTYSDDGGGNKYTAFTEKMRARMLTYTEAKSLGCTTSDNSCPKWLHVNLSGSNTETNPYSYWIPAAVSSSSSNAYNIFHSGKIHQYSASTDNVYGVRPVISLPKYNSEISIKLNLENVEMFKDSVFKLEANIPLNRLQFASANNNIATVSSNGIVTGVSEGTTTVTVKTIDGSNLNKKITITVNSQKTLSDLVTTSVDVTSIPTCITNNTTCAAGTPVAIKVNESEIYNFYVINETDGKVTLIMDRNLGGKVAWISKYDYDITNLDYTSCSYDSCNDKGPVTAARILKERTDDWTNIPTMEYTYSDDSNGSNYEGPTIVTRARMLTYIEATTAGCTTGFGSCPSSSSWLFTNTSTSNTMDEPYGYWMTSSPSSKNYANFITCYKFINKFTTTETNGAGVRPVITLSK